LIGIQMGFGPALPLITIRRVSGSSHTNRGRLAVRILAFGILVVTLATPALALPVQPLSADKSATLQDVVEIKGHGHGHGHGRAFGWSRGKKVGWRRGCPPGLWKQGRC
jgi:hypothetical protein